MKARNGDKIILDLCGGTGAWGRPYKEAGYDVRVITLPDYDILDCQVRPPEVVFPGNIDEAIPQLIPRNKIYGVLCAPPCTMFSFARTNARTYRNLAEGMKLVRACLDIVWKLQEKDQDTKKKYTALKFWALENPYFGLLKNFLGKPTFVFDPWEFGDGYQKRTALWGNFNEPKKNPILMTEKMKELAKTNSYLHTMKNPTNRGKPPSIWAKKDLKKFDMLKSKDICPESFGQLDRQARRAITPAGFAKAFFEANQ